jgi:hypothetical protein
LSTASNHERLWIIVQPKKAGSKAIMEKRQRADGSWEYRSLETGEVRDTAQGITALHRKLSGKPVGRPKGAKNKPKDKAKAKAKPAAAPVPAPTPEPHAEPTNVIDFPATEEPEVKTTDSTQLEYVIEQTKRLQSAVEDRLEELKAENEALRARIDELTDALAVIGQDALTAAKVHGSVEETD